MRFNPDTERALNIDAIAEQCRRAITKATEPVSDPYSEILSFYRWEDDILRLIPEPIAA
jgi:hypothetical protein